MAAIRFATTQLRGLHAAGRTSDLQHALISATLARNLGERYAHLLAEFEVRGSDSRDWFVSSQPIPVRISDLAPERQAALRAECSRMIAAIHKLATTIEEQGVNGRNLARVLRDATVYPDEDLWEYNGGPLILNWGFRRTTQSASSPVAIAENILIAAQQTNPESPIAETSSLSAPASSKRRQSFWSVFKKKTHILLWLAFIALAVVIYDRLLPACGVTVGLLPGRMVGNCLLAGANLDLSGEGLRLQREIERAELDLAQQRKLCVRPASKRADNSTEFNRDIEMRLPTGSVRGGTEVALFWQGTADLDLIIECPGGSALSRKDRAACGGKMLDDMNRNDQSLTSSPIEYAAWSTLPAAGLYKIYVELYSYRTVPEGTTIPFRIGIKSPTGFKMIDGGEIIGRGNRVLASTEAF
jgi:hypothetical protein